MPTRLAGRVAALLVVPLLLAEAACGGGGGRPVETPSATASPALAPTRPSATTPAATPGIAADATPRPPATLELSADPQKLICDGVHVSNVIARVLDAAGEPVADGAPVHFSVQVLGSADPVNARTVAGIATTSVTARGEGVGVVVNVASGEAAQGIRIDCQ